MMISSIFTLEQLAALRAAGFKAIFSLADGIDVAAERDRINVLLGADIMQIGTDNRTIECPMGDLYALEED